jgi:hypothetical protein
VAIAAAAVVTALVAAGAGASAISSAYSVTGVEVAATSVEGTFVGTGAGTGGDTLLWKAVVDHTPLSTNPASPATITGGSLAATSLGASGLATLSGSFTGGTVAYDPARSSSAPCGNQVYDVTGNLALASGSSTGTGTFQVYLTHYRISFFGSCITFAASVTGTPGLLVSL